MKKRSKRYREAQKLVDKDKIYSIKEAIEILKKMPKPKIDETLEISCKLDIDSKQSDQIIRGSVTLPHGTGKSIRVAVFCEPEKESKAKEAGADVVGSTDLIDKIAKGENIDFDYCISTPGMMKHLSKIGKILGPRSLMPSPKTGTVTENISFAVKEAKKGKIDFRMDKFGCIYAGIGKISFPNEALVENVEAFVEAVKNSRPQGVKPDFIKSIFLSLTFNPSVRIL